VEAAADGCLARRLAVEAAANAGVLGLLKSSSGSHIASVFGQSSSLGSDAMSALGGLIGNKIGESFGVGGLGITNNQELGVDEGDIVKASREHLVILRRGRLYSVRYRRQGVPVLAPEGRCPVSPPGGAYDSWYDELLLYRDRIVVVGYSYAIGAAELGLFRLGPDGAISHEATYFLRSGDYYSSRNYAGRLLGSKLVLYAPVSLDGPPDIAVGRWDARRRRVAEWRRLLTAREIYRPVQPVRYPTLHTLVQCGLDRLELRCSARGLIAGHARTLYVSRQAIYLWSADDEAKLPATVYRVPLDGRQPTALLAEGSPIDQLSFQEADGQLHVLTSEGGGDAMWSPELAHGRLRLLRVPLSAFSRTPSRVAAHRCTSLPPDNGGSLQNRFVGDWLLYGSGSGWLPSKRNGGRVVAVSVRDPRSVHRLSLDHGVDRIEAAGRNAIVVGSGRRDLFFTSIELGGVPAVRATKVRHGAAQGETRTHGFTFLPDGEGGGVLGLPVRREAPIEHLLLGSAEVVFLQLSPSLRFRALGSLVARPPRKEDHGCKVSCVDWYGNARPIFLDGRIFALLGDEVIEGYTELGRLAEWQRAHVRRAR
jgi:hypothetical protein